MVMVVNVRYKAVFNKKIEPEQPAKDYSSDFMTVLGPFCAPCFQMWHLFILYINTVDLIKNKKIPELCLKRLCAHTCTHIWTHLRMQPVVYQVCT